jgi:hypothetical protein
MGMTNNDHENEAPLPAAEQRAAAAYHAPPDTVPRDAMWQAIQARRSAAGVLGVTAVTVADTAHDDAPPPVIVERTTRGALRRLPRWATATAAAVAAAVAVTLMLPRVITAPVATVTAAADSVAGALAWRVASTEHFGMAESMLTSLSYSSQAQSDAQLTAWSRDLLESTRLLMDSPAGRDPKRRVLLMDLELVLVQLVESGPTMRAEDRSVMDDLMSRSALLLTRIRTTVPAGVSAEYQ